ncbi:MAG: TerB family tellurite resistance protein [Rhodospirillaceae bacterium]|nr:TerB family tellurite resistance protein [Rhodospirillaceae bacterium]
MSIWGKVLGGAAGFAVGGPLGALLGAAAGHAVDALRGEPAAAEDETARAAPEGGPALDAVRQLAFTIGVIVLGAKMARSEGYASAVNTDAFRTIFHVPPHELKTVGRLFERARSEPAGFEPYARQIAAMFRRQPAVLEKLLDSLFHIARGDGVIGPQEIGYLRKVARIFGLSEAQFTRIRDAHLRGDGVDPYVLLGVTRRHSDAEIKAAYRRLIRETHPDRLMAAGMPKEFVDMATQRLAAINAAYDRVAAERGLT